MSNAVNDWANGITYAPAIAAPTVALATSITGTGVDCIQLDGNMGCLQVIGTSAGVGFTYAGKVQEADTATGTYADISGATLTAVGSTTGAQIVAVCSFQRTKRFVRYVGIVGGTTPTAALDALFLGRTKQL
jgi:succinyl-CoA synthetase beta subunit